MKYKHLIIEAILVIALVLIGIYAIQQNLQKQTEQQGLPKVTTLIGEFNTTKGDMGVVNGTLLPYFENKPDEASNYVGKIVEISGVIYDPEYPSDFIVQEFGGPHMAITSIRII